MSPFTITPFRLSFHHLSFRRGRETLKVLWPPFFLITFPHQYKSRPDFREAATASASYTTCVDALCKLITRRKGPQEGKRETASENRGSSVPITCSPSDVVPPFPAQREGHLIMLCLLACVCACFFARNFGGSFSLPNSEWKRGNGRGGGVSMSTTTDAVEILLPLSRYCCRSQRRGIQQTPCRHMVKSASTTVADDVVSLVSAFDLPCPDRPAPRPLFLVCRAV